MKIKISTDSTCDLPAELIAAHDIGVQPLYIIRDGEALRDGIDVTPDDLYAYTKETGKLCGTSAVTITDYLGSWKAWLEEYDAIVHVAFSSELSASCNNARLAAMELPGKVWVVDSLNLSTGFGHLVLDAALMAERGMAPEEIAAEVERLVPKMDVSFVLNTLDYLKKGGRCTSVQALGANLLGLKPCIEVIGGKMTVGKKYRGSFQRCLEHYIQDKLERREEIDFSRAFLVHNLCAPGVVEHVQSYLTATANFRELYVVPAGSTICCHCGPSTLGLMFTRKTPKQIK